MVKLYQVNQIGCSQHLYD